MAAPVLVHHPDFPATVREVPAESVKDWTDAGWVRVKRESPIWFGELATRPSLPFRSNPSSFLSGNGGASPAHPRQGSQKE